MYQKLNHSEDVTLSQTSYKYHKGVHYNNEHTPLQYSTKLLNTK